MLEYLDRQRLRFVHHHHRPTARLALREQVAVQIVDQRLAAGGRRRQSELQVDGLEQLDRRQRRVDDVGDARFRRQLGEEVAQNGGFAGADVSRDAHEAARLRQTEPEMGQRIGMLARQEEKPGVRREPEGRIRQPEEPLVHRRLRRPSIRRPGAPPGT